MSASVAGENCLLTDATTIDPPPAAQTIEAFDATVIQPQGVGAVWMQLRSAVAIVLIAYHSDRIGTRNR